MESDIATLKNINNVLSKPVFSSEREVWRNTQCFQRECVEISGIPASVDHKELEPSVCKVPQHIGVDITEERIEPYHHVNRSRVRTILIFSKRNDSEKVMRQKSELRNLEPTQPAITCSKLTIETLEQGVKYVQR